MCQDAELPNGEVFHVILKENKTHVVGIDQENN
jgi:hypothetical protein